MTDLDATVTADRIVESLLEGELSKSIASYMLKGEMPSYRETKLRDMIREVIQEEMQK